MTKEVRRRKNQLLRDRIKIDVCINGVTVWLDGLWIIDASTILYDGRVTLSMDKFRKIKCAKKYKKYNHQEFELKEL